MKFQYHWTPKRWRKEIKLLPACLTLPNVAKRFGKGIPTTCIRLRQYGYKIKETRGGFGGVLKLPPKTIKRIDWCMTNSAISGKFGVSRERIRQVRAEQGRPKANGRK